MTTIAYRNGTMCADRRTSAQDVHQAKVTKLTKINGWLLGVSGDLMHGPGIVKLLTEKIANDQFGEGVLGKLEWADDSYLGAILVDPKRQVYFIENTKSGVIAAARVEAPFVARGSGRDFALAAMEMGASPSRAVEIAAQFDNGTGEGFDMIELDEAIQPPAPTTVSDSGEGEDDMEESCTYCGSRMRLDDAGTCMTYDGWQCPKCTASAEEHYASIKTAPILQDKDKDEEAGDGDRVTVNAADYNPRSERAWDGFPFSASPKWLRDAVSDQRIRPHTRGSTDYAQWDVDTPDGVINAEPGDEIYRDHAGTIRVSKCASNYERATPQPQQPATPIPEAILGGPASYVEFSLDVCPESADAQIQVLHEGGLLSAVMTNDPAIYLSHHDRGYYHLGVLGDYRQRGVKDREAGLALDECPFGKMCLAAELWKQGWYSLDEIQSDAKQTDPTDKPLIVDDTPTIPRSEIPQGAAVETFTDAGVETVKLSGITHIVDDAPERVAETQPEAAYAPIHNEDEPATSEQLEAAGITKPGASELAAMRTAKSKPSFIERVLGIPPTPKQTAEEGV